MRWVDSREFACEVARCMFRSTRSVVALKQNQSSISSNPRLPRVAVRNIKNRELTGCKKASDCLQLAMLPGFPNVLVPRTTLCLRCERESDEEDSVHAEVFPLKTASVS